MEGRKQCVKVRENNSEQCNVISGVPQGSVLGPMLFTIYINDIDESLNSDISKFADDTKIGKVVNDEKDAAELQNDLQILYEWSVKWQMEFNLNKCVCVHVGKKNKLLKYSLGGIVLEEVQKERDLGVIIDSSEKVGGQCAMVVRRANNVLRQIRRKIKCKSKNVILRLYKSLVRPHLDYCVQAWCPYLKKRY